MNRTETIASRARRESAHDTIVAEPQLVLALDCARPLTRPARFSLAGVNEVRLGRGPERCLDRSEADGRRVLCIQVPDTTMSSQHARLQQRDGHWSISDAASKNGTFVDGARIDEQQLASSCVINVGNTLFLFRANGKAVVNDPPDVDLTATSDEDAALTTLSGALARDFTRLRAIAASAVPVLILGPTGTGKELVASAVHALSGRSGPFTAVNCGALAGTLVVSELFGAKRGAYSGATDNRLGLVRASDRGTLFLDEIAELTPSAQAALLRVLQEKEVLPVGGSRPIKVDIRVLAATLRDLPAAVAAGAFREDLYARLAGHSVTLPPLRERKEDIGLMVATLLPRLAGSRAASVAFEPETARALFVHDWPLNIRELEHALSTALTVSKTGRIAPDELPWPVRRAIAPEAPTTSAAKLSALLAEHQGNLSAVARAMATSRSQVRRLLDRFGLDLESFRPK